MSNIDLAAIFSQLKTELFDDLNYTLQVFAEETIKEIAEQWADMIIDTILNQKLIALSPETINTRALRGKNLLGPDYPLLEEGSWIQFIEFRVTRYGTDWKLEVGVFDETTMIGHSNDRSPDDIAWINEYGYAPANIPARNLFTDTDLRIESQLSKIVMSTWERITNQFVMEHVAMISNNDMLLGHIVTDGAKFKFEWVVE